MESIGRSVSTEVLGNILTFTLNVILISEGTIKVK